MSSEPMELPETAGFAQPPFTESEASQVTLADAVEQAHRLSVQVISVWLPGFCKISSLY